MRKCSSLLFVASLVVLSCDGDEQPESRSVKKVTRASCSMTRIAGGSKKAISLDFELSVDDSPFSSEQQLDAFGGSYGFSVFVLDDSLDVIITEHDIVMDEDFAFGCGKVPKKKGAAFCTQEIKVNKNLGIEDAQPARVKAFEFSCKTL